MSAEAPQAEEQNRNLSTVRTIIAGTVLWGLRDVDAMSNGSAYVFYVRSKKKIRYWNVLGELCMDKFDYSAVCPAQLIMEDPDRAANYVLEQVVEAVKVAKNGA